MNTAVLFSSAKDEWATPRDFFEVLDREFRFTVDAAASPENTQCRKWYGKPMRPHDLDDGALTDFPGWYEMDGAGPYWLNPPYSQNRAFIAKAAQEAAKGCTVVCLVPARTDVRWFHEHVYNATENRWRPGVEVRFIKGRLKFGGSTNSAPFPSMLVIFRPADGDRR